MTTLTLGYSTCPNDTYIFGGLALGAVSIPGVELEITLADVEALNRSAVSGGLHAAGPDICKFSVAAAASILDEYWLLRAGGAMGYGVGPLLVAGRAMDLQGLNGGRIAVPGRKTTATLLLGLMLREASVSVDYSEMVFDQVMDAVLREEAEAGVIIHEGRFTFGRRGLHKLADLGAWWEKSRRLPIPLGCIAIRRSLGTDVAQAVNQGIRESLAFARADESLVWPYVRRHAQEMADAVMLEHIRTFVTEYSMDIGADGETAITALLEEAGRESGISLPGQPIFVPSD